MDSFEENQLMYVYGCFAYKYVSASYVASAHRDQKRASVPLELELETIPCGLMLGTKPEASAGAASALHSQAISLDPLFLFFF